MKKLLEKLEVWYYTCTPWVYAVAIVFVMLLILGL